MAKATLSVDVANLEPVVELVRAMTDEVEALRSVVNLLVEGVSATCSEVHIGRRQSPWVPVSDTEFAAIERALAEPTSESRSA